MTTSSNTNDTSSGPKHVSASRASGRGRKTKNDSSSSSSQKKSKIPQRGPSIQMLIELQEQRKKMTEIAPPPQTPLPFNTTFAVPHHHQLNGQFQFPQPSVNYFNGVVGDHHHHVYPTNELSSIQNSFVKCVSDGCGACYKKNRINGGGSITCSVNPYRNYAANSSAFFETIDTARPLRVEVREVKEVMPVSRNGMSLTTEHECFLGKKSKL